jgi:hypothetical protein
MPKVSSERVAEYALVFALLYSVVNGYAFTPDLVRAIEQSIIISSLFALSSFRRVLTNLKKRLATATILGALSDIESPTFGSN